VNIRYTPRADASPEIEAEALAAVYTFILECHETKKATEKTDGDESGEAAEHDHTEKIVAEKRKS